jgi:putative tryptophan/tyrosine transport system substrate-binding protein
MVQKIYSVALAAFLSLLILNPAMAQDGAKPRRVGLLMAWSLSDPVTKRTWQTLVDSLRELGWEEGRNLVLESRFSGPDPARYHDLAAELVALKVDVIVAGNSQSTEAARRKTTTIPIVMLNITDPVTLGFVASLARPGGDITGLSNQMTVVEKWFEFLKAIQPGIERVSVVYNPDNAGSVNALKYQQEVAPHLGLVVIPTPVSKPADFDAAFATIARERLQALLVHPNQVAFTHRSRIVAFAIEQRLPTFTASSLLARDGFLMSYGWDILANWRRAATYVDRVLRGANPADLPVEQADRFELVVNLKTARELGLTIPPSILLRADEVIE